MQALTLWSSWRSTSWMGAHVDVEMPLLSADLTTRRRGRIEERWVLSRRGRLIFVPSSTPWVSNGFGACFSNKPYFCKYSIMFEIPAFPKKKSFYGANFALALTSEGGQIASQSAEENPESLRKVSESFNVAVSEEEGISIRELSRSGHNYDDVHGNGEDEEVGTDKEEEVSSNKGKVNEEKGERIDVLALAQTLHACKTSDDVEEVLKDKGELPLQVYSSIIRGLGKDKKLESAMALVDWLKRKSKDNNGATRPNLFIYNSLLGAVRQSEKYDVVEQIVNEMALEEVHPSVVTLNTLMSIYVGQGKELEALSLLKQMPEKGLSPSPASYSTALFAYRRLEDGFGALEFFKGVKDKYEKGEIGKCRDEDWENEFPKLENFTLRICYQVMRQWLVKSENSNTNVLGLLTDMDKSGLQLGRAEHERLLWACTHEEHYVVAKEIYNRIRERYPQISLSVCNHVIWLMGKAKKWWAALEIYEDLLDKGPKPNNMSYELIVSHFNILLTAARKRGIWRWGVRLLNKMEEKGLKPGSREWNAVLVACSKASETTAAIQIFRRMVEQGEKPTIISYGALLSALEKGKLYDEALRVWKHMIKVGVEPNLYAYTIMASTYTAQGKFNIVNSIIREMVTVGVQPTVVTFNAIISGCARNNMGSAAYEWFQQMKTLNISPNEITYEMLIEALANDGKPRLVYELYLRSQNEGLNLSSKAYDAVVHSSEVYGAAIDITTLGPRPPEKKKKVQIRKSLSEFCNTAGVPRRSKPFDKKEMYPTQAEGNSE